MAIDREWVPDEALEALQQERMFSGEGEEDLANRLLRENLPAAVMSVCNLAIHSNNENTRLRAAQYVIDRNMGRIAAPGEGATENWEEKLGSFFAPKTV
jgi:hypothetical protein